MEFLNQSGVAAGWTLGFESDGRELLIVAIKATYTLPTQGSEPTLAEEQIKLTTADEFTGEPGRSAPLRETDFSHRKPKCDVVLNGSAWASGGRPARSVEVGLRVGSLCEILLRLRRPSLAGPLALLQRPRTVRKPAHLLRPRLRRRRR